jgi:CheY-like chemotaxis protein
MAKTKSIQIDVAMDPIDPLLGDADRLRQAFWNVLVNAVKFTPEHGRITVRMKKADRAAEVQISDTGEGISPALLPNLFERFRQGDSSSTRKHAGLGIGLSIVRTVVELHKGKVRAYSEGPGKGATFIITLPLLLPEQAALAQPAEIENAKEIQRSESEARPLRGLKLLVVDDHAETREFLQVSMNAAGAAVEACASAEQAFESFERAAPDVLISDIGMPEKDGLWLIAKVRELERERGLKPVAAIALTAFAMEFDRRRCLEAGFARHVAKPIAIAELIGTVFDLAVEHSVCDGQARYV